MHPSAEGEARPVAPRAKASAFSLAQHLALLAAGVAVPLLACIAYLAWVGYETRRAALVRAVVDQAAETARIVDGFAATAEAVLAVAGGLLQPTAARFDENSDILRRLQADLPDFVNTVNIFGPDGDLWGTSLQDGPEPKARWAGDRLYARAALETGAFAAGGPVISRSIGRWTVAFAEPVRDPAGRIAAVVTLSLRLEALQASIGRDLALPPGSTVTVVAADGGILARSLDPESWIGRNIGDHPGYREAVLRRQGAETLVSADGVPRLSAYTTARQVPWLVYVGIPTEAAYAPLRRDVLQFALVGAGVLLLAWLVGLRIAGHVRRTVGEIGRGAALLAAGTLDRPIETGGPRELVALAGQINAMAAALRRREAELRQATQESQRSRDMLETIIEAEPACVKIVGADGRVVRMNAAGLAMCAAERIEQIEGRPIADLVLPEDWPGFEAHFRRVLGGAREHAEFRIGDLAGRQRIMASVAAPLVTEGPEGERTAYIAVSRDVTEEREAEAQRRQAQKLTAIGELTGGVAHDFNNLLTVILGSLEQLEGAAPDPRARTLLANALRAGERAAELTGHLLAFSRRQPLDPKVLDVNALIARWLDLLRRTLGEDIAVTAALAEGLWPTQVDPVQLESALINLAVNARDAMPEGGRLTVETANVELDGAYVMIALTDTGQGMPPHVLERAFEPFFTTKEAGRGTGLGLSMVHGFVKQSGGHIKIYSEPGSGTAVKMYLPRSEAAAAALVPAPAAPAPRGRGETVLLVEDDALVRDLAAGTLTALGYAVRSAADGPAALRILEAGEPVDLLFTDVVMPGGLNGRQLAEAARRLRPGLKVLYTSGYAENAILHHGRLDRDVLLVAKPWRRDALARKLRQALDRDDLAPAGG